ncbi:MAG: tRNA (adenosine(37)-N6)-threonylcarbamoyltransferase complex dimerization subunit type 1 TsaB [Dehalococcoidia bacterium]|nr:tRNA (adenosine(37)-N6)-threonylcarbamoyltransferase complex dimerization subunit type 1 TsaB [Dehalococcoidia bacterium]RLC63359.1 MAG: tRNA (adenosine(37)-N6)-threonylcarbamoyltransferase complex dimerization subunit type 1 TsaB [Chloroflexota bacterium]
MELAIDTSSNTVSVALSNQGRIVASLTWQTIQNHTVELLPNLVCLLQQARVELSSIEAIVVAKGPGSFNGLRVGISTAKGLACTLNVPLLGINTLEAEAYPFAFTGLPLRPIGKAGREEIATALYQQKDNEWQCLEAENLTTVKTLCRRIKQKTLFCGEIPAEIIRVIRQNLGRRAIISQSNSPSRASSLATLGWQKLSRGKQDDPVTLQPLYLRPPHITKPKDKIPQLPSRVE